MHQREIIIQSINHQIETFTEQFLMAAENGGTIPLIEIDLMKQTIRTLYQQLHELQIINQRPMDLEPPTIQQPTSRNPSVAENPTIANTPMPEPEEIKEYVHIPEVFIINDIPSEKMVSEIVVATQKEEIVNISLEPQMQPLNIQAEQPIVVEEKAAIQPKVILNSPSEIAEIAASIAIEKNSVTDESKKVYMSASLFDDIAPTVASKYKEQESLYNKISKTQQGATIAEKLSAKPVMDLRKSIGINERFAFINELFAGNQQLFMESIDKLNNMPIYDDARRVLYEELAGKMNWNTNAKTFSDLDELVKRRFSA